jgi:transposase-like protein
MGLSFRDVVTVFESLCADRSRGTIRNWTHVLTEAQSDPPTAAPPRVAVDEIRIEVNTAEK